MWMHVGKEITNDLLKLIIKNRKSITKIEKKRFAIKISTSFEYELTKKT